MSNIKRLFSTPVREKRKGEEASVWKWSSSSLLSRIYKLLVWCYIARYGELTRQAGQKCYYIMLCARCNIYAFFPDTCTRSMGYGEDVPSDSSKWPYDCLLRCCILNIFISIWIWLLKNTKWDKTSRRTYTLALALASRSSIYCYWSDC